MIDSLATPPTVVHIANCRGTNNLHAIFAVLNTYDSLRGFFGRLPLPIAAAVDFPPYGIAFASWRCITIDNAPRTQGNCRKPVSIRLVSSSPRDAGANRVLPRCKYRTSTDTCCETFIQSSKYFSSNETTASALEPSTCRYLGIRTW